MRQNQKKDILFTCQFFYPEYVTSAALAFDTAKALKDAGYTVDALCGYPKEYCEAKTCVGKKENVDGINIKRVRYLQLSRSFPAGRIINYISFIMSMAMHFPMMAKYKVIVVYSSPPILPLLAAMANSFFGAKLVFVCHDVYPEIAIRSGVIGEKSCIARLMNHINKYVFKRAERVVALSSDMKLFLEENRNIRRGEVAVIPNWHKDLFEPSETVPTDKDKFCVAYLGNMGTCQDMDTIFSAMQRLAENKHICFMFAGHGNKLDEARSTAEKYGNAEVCGFLRGEEYMRKMAESDCFVVSLEKNIVGLGVPSKTYSYMMMGKPIIAIMEDCDITEDLKHYKCGIKVENGDVEGFVRAVCFLAENPDKCYEMGQGSRLAFSEKYTQAAAAKKYVGMMSEIFDLD